MWWCGGGRTGRSWEGEGAGLAAWRRLGHFPIAVRQWTFVSIAVIQRSEEHTSELQSHSDLHSFPTRRSSDLGSRERGLIMSCTRVPGGTWRVVMNVVVRRGKNRTFVGRGRGWTSSLEKARTFPYCSEAVDFCLNRRDPKIGRAHV